MVKSRTPSSSNSFDTVVTSVRSFTMWDYSTPQATWRGPVIMEGTVHMYRHNLTDNWDVQKAELRSARAVHRSVLCLRVGRSNHSSLFIITWQSQSSVIPLPVYLALLHWQLEINPTTKGKLSQGCSCFPVRFGELVIIWALWSNSPQSEPVC